MAAAVVLSEDFPRDILSDSKRIGERARSSLESRIRLEAAHWGISCAWPDEIDSLNIHWATLLAMRRAFDSMRGTGSGWAENTPERLELTEGGGRDVSQSLELGSVVVDGRFVPELPWPAEAVVGGDHTIAEIMAASILAKTARDRWMIAYAEKAPGYGFERHKGYPTPAHRRAILELGPSPIHRSSFRLSPSASGAPRGSARP